MSDPSNAGANYTGVYQERPGQAEGPSRSGSGLAKYPPVTRPQNLRLGLSGPLPARVPAEAKELVLKTVHDAVAEGFAHSWVCSLWQVSDDRVQRWRARRRATGTLVDRAAGGGPVRGILPHEIDAILEVAERWGPIDRVHR